MHDRNNKFLHEWFRGFILERFESTRRMARLKFSKLRAIVSMIICFNWISVIHPSMELLSILTFVISANRKIYRKKKNDSRHYVWWRSRTFGGRSISEYYSFFLYRNNKRLSFIIGSSIFDRWGDNWMCRCVCVCGWDGVCDFSECVRCVCFDIISLFDHKPIPKDWFLI